jgi:hypothetical protein
MARIFFATGVVLLLAACGAGGGGSATEADCYNTPVKQGDTATCGYYPGYGWARVPVFTSIRQN